MVTSVRTWTVGWTGGLILALSSVPATSARASGGDWPQWRGADQTNVSAETGWKVEGGREAWKRDVGLGYSSVVVVDGRVYTLGWSATAEGSDAGEDTLWCLDEKSGDVLWKKSYPAQKWAKFHGGGTNSTPTVGKDGRVYVLNREGRFHCFEGDDGSEVFALDLAEEYGLELPTWGFAASPVILEDRVVVNVGRILAFDLDGQPLWKTESTGHAYCTPLVMGEGERSSLVFVNGDGVFEVTRDGALSKQADWKTQYDVNAATPVAVGDGRCFVSSGYGHGCCLVKLGGKKPGAVLWENKEMKNHMSGSILHEEHLFGFDENVLKCLDLSGETAWQQRGLGKGALTLADGKLILLTDEGELVFAKASTKGFEELGRTKVLDGGVCWTSPVLAHGRIYCRNSLGQLVCRDHSARSTP